MHFTFRKPFNFTKLKEGSMIQKCLEHWTIRVFLKLSNNSWVKMIFNGPNNAYHFFSGRIICQNDLNLFSYERLRVTSK